MLRKCILLINSAPPALYSMISSSFFFTRSNKISRWRAISVDDKQNGIITFSQNCCGVPLARSNENFNLTKSRSFRKFIWDTEASTVCLGISFNISITSCFQSRASRGFKRGFKVYKAIHFVTLKRVILDCSFVEECLQNASFQIKAWSLCVWFLRC